ncbi:phage holin family protein [Oceanobacter kriegii]|uniref:phage holin family protein n=1 Tax=Oceanobacter kriegii TaxID=64972 RepID=UPI000428CDCC|nr:phage holin family protein [Oceanobacter kriegii]
MNAIAIIIALVAIAACLRLLTFKRSGSQHKRSAAISAWLACWLLAAIAVRSVTGTLPNNLTIQLLMLAVLVAFTVRIYQTHGNIAAVLKGTHHA